MGTVFKIAQTLYSFQFLQKAVYKSKVCFLFSRVWLRHVDDIFAFDHKKCIIKSFKLPFCNY